ncbi:MAG TPA: hypothetical protein VN222_14475 [Novosphingobium sp.]|nr:hypothetical protein [Novosphingobium sp.]
MQISKIIGLTLAAVTMTAAAAPAMAHPGDRGHKVVKVCKTVRDHHHVKRVCRTVRR